MYTHPNGCWWGWRHRTSILCHVPTALPWAVSWRRSLWDVIPAGAGVCIPRAPLSLQSPARLCHSEVYWREVHRADTSVPPRLGLEGFWRKLCSQPRFWAKHHSTNSPHPNQLHELKEKSHFLWRCEWLAAWAVLLMSEAHTNSWRQWQD